MLSQEEFAEIDNRVDDYSYIQMDIAVIKEENYEENLEELQSYDEEHTQFIAYSIIDMFRRRLNKDEILAKLYFDLMSQPKNKDVMMDELFKYGGPILRRVYDLGAFQNDEIERRNAKSYAVFGDIFPDQNTQVEYNGAKCTVTKDWIYHRYPEGTPERAIFDNEPEKALELLNAHSKTVDDLIVKSPFDFYDEPGKEIDRSKYYEESTLPSYFGLAIHCGALKCFNEFKNITRVTDFSTLVDFAIKNGTKQYYTLLKDCFKAKVNGKYTVAARYFNYSLMIKLESKGEGTMVWNNVSTVYKYRDEVHDQVEASYVYDLIDHIEFNDVTKWFLCVRGMSMYSGSKYSYYASTHNNQEIAKFVKNQVGELL